MRAGNIVPLPFTASCKKDRHGQAERSRPSKLIPLFWVEQFFLCKSRSLFLGSGRVPVEDAGSPANGLLGRGVPWPVRQRGSVTPITDMFSVFFFSGHQGSWPHWFPGTVYPGDLNKLSGFIFRWY